MNTLPKDLLRASLLSIFALCGFLWVAGRAQAAKPVYWSVAKAQSEAVAHVTIPYCKASPCIAGKPTGPDAASPVVVVEANCVGLGTPKAAKYASFRCFWASNNDVIDGRVVGQFEN